MGVPEKNLIVETNGSGVCLIDYDNDGWQDIYLVNGATFDSLDGKEESQVTIGAGGQQRSFRAQVYLYHFAMPNFYFHVTTAYNILRSLGIEIGKRDFMGPMPS